MERPLRIPPRPCVLPDIGNTHTPTLRGRPPHGHLKRPCHQVFRNHQPARQSTFTQLKRFRFGNGNCHGLPLNPFGHNLIIQNSLLPIFALAIGETKVASPLSALGYWVPKISTSDFTGPIALG